MLFLFSPLSLAIVNAAESQKLTMDRSDFWLYKCGGQSEVSALCIAYVKGVADVALALSAVFREQGKNPAIRDGPNKQLLSFGAEIEKSILGCSVDLGVNMLQVTKTWLKYLESHPERHHLSPVDTIGSAMRAAFPCKQ